MLSDHEEKINVAVSSVATEAFMLDLNGALEIALETYKFFFFSIFRAGLSPHPLIFRYLLNSTLCRAAYGRRADNDARTRSCGGSGHGDSLVG